MWCASTDTQVVDGVFLGHLDDCALQPFGEFPLSARSASAVEDLDLNLSLQRSLGDLMKTKVIRRHYFFSQIFQRVSCFLAASVSSLYLDKVSDKVACAYVPSSKA